MLWISLHSSAQPACGKAYIFSCFNNNGEDGLHLAYSLDGYHLQALNKDSAVLKPTVAKDKLMRDPCIIKWDDELFHMVWTVSWNDKGMEYASSKNLFSPQMHPPIDIPK